MGTAGHTMGIIDSKHVVVVVIIDVIMIEDLDVVHRWEGQSFGVITPLDVYSVVVRWRAFLVHSYIGRWTIPWQATGRVCVNNIQAIYGPLVPYNRVDIGESWIADD